MRGVKTGASANWKRQWQARIIPLENNNNSSMVVMETGDLSYVFWSWAHGKNYKETTCDHKHTHMQIHAKKQKLHKPQEPNKAVAHFSTGLCMSPKNKGSLQRKKSSVQGFSCYWLYRVFWDDFGDGKSWCYISYQIHAHVGLSNGLPWLPPQLLKAEQYIKIVRKLRPKLNAE